MWLGNPHVSFALLRHGLVSEPDRHRQATWRFERAAPNELWQMDFKGPKSWHQSVGPLSVLDDHSRYAIMLQAEGSTRENWCGSKQIWHFCVAHNKQKNR